MYVHRSLQMTHPLLAVIGNNRESVTCLYLAASVDVNEASEKLVEDKVDDVVLRLRELPVWSVVRDEVVLAANAAAVREDV